jgi:hypothetical protein
MARGALIIFMNWRSSYPFPNFTHGPPPLPGGALKKRSIDNFYFT